MIIYQTTFAQSTKDIFEEFEDIIKTKKPKKNKIEDIFKTKEVDIGYLTSTSDYFDKLNKENNWTHTWEQIEKSDKYQVKEKNIPTGYTVTYTKEDNKFIITNTKELVQTGKNNLVSPILALSGLMLITIGFIILNSHILLYIILYICNLIHFC